MEMRRRKDVDSSTRPDFAKGTCNQSPEMTGVFFPVPSDRKGIALAKSLCRICPVQVECLEYALYNREPFGVWGGQTEDERRRTVHRSTRAPRIPRPVRPSCGTLAGAADHAMYGEASCPGCQRAHEQYIYQGSASERIDPEYLSDSPSGPRTPLPTYPATLPISVSIE